MMTAVIARFERGERGNNRIFSVTLCLLLIAILLTLLRRQTPFSGESKQHTSALERTVASRILKVGYAGFTPYTIINLQSGQPELTGLCVDIITEIASRQTPPWQVEWHKVSWETLRADMDSGAFDVLAEPVYMTPARAANFLFTQPFSFFGGAIGVVRKGEHRFQKFEDLNTPSVTISLAEGWTSTEFAQRHLPKSTMRVLPVGDDPFISFFDVIAGRADIALQDAPTTIQFARAHPDSVELKWAENPPMLVAAGFLMRRGDFGMKHFLDAALLALQTEGTIQEIDRKWLGLGHYEAMALEPGQGLKR